MDNAEVSQNSMNAFVIGKMILNFVLSASLNLLWSLLNSLQIIVALPLMNINMPYNVFLISLNLQ